MGRTKEWLAVMASVLAAAGCREAPSVRPVQPPRSATPAPVVTPVATSPALPIPFESEGACPFECCVYRTWSVERPTDVRQSRAQSAPLAFSLQPREKVEAETGVVVVTRPGRARAPRDVKIEGLGELRQGDEVAVLHPLGAGFGLVWRDGKTGSGQVGEKAARPGPWEPELLQVEKPTFRWWIRVRDGKGRTGWTDTPENFGNKDRCG